VAEAVANIACVGATPVALVNCLNFGNPEHPEVMWQLAEAIDGMADACRALDLPVVGGNVSLYNEAGGRDIDPTPAVGVLGLVDALVTPPPGWSWREGDTIVVLGDEVTHADGSAVLGGSRLATHRGERDGSLPAFEASAFIATTNFVRARIAHHVAGLSHEVTAVHDVGSGGLLMALAEMAAVAGVGLQVTTGLTPDHLFSELPGRYVVATADADAVVHAARAAGVTATVIGTAGGDHFVVDTHVAVSLNVLRARREGALTSVLGH
jgi:phosphoribosylformylglycinamidine synthase